MYGTYISSQLQDFYYTYLPKNQSQAINLNEGKDVFFEDAADLETFLRYSTYNGEIISALAHQLVTLEKIKKILFVRTPSTGGWIEKLNFCITTDIEREYYFDERQHSSKIGIRPNFNKREDFELEIQKNNTTRLGV